MMNYLMMKINKDQLFYVKYIKQLLCEKITWKYQ